MCSPTSSTMSPGGPVVHRPHEGSERRLVDVQDALVGMVRRGHVREGQGDAGGDLDDDEHQRGAAQRVPPADVAGHLAVEEGTTQRVDAQALVDPGADASHRQAPGARRPTWTSPSTTLVSYWIIGSRRRAGQDVALDVEGAPVAGAEEGPGAAAKASGQPRCVQWMSKATTSRLGLADDVGGHRPGGR